jgi:hypothetical protein
MASWTDQEYENRRILWDKDERDMNFPEKSEIIEDEAWAEAEEDE